MRRPLVALALSTVLVSSLSAAIAAAEPVVSITEPAEGAVVAGTVRVSVATAVVVTSVEFDWSSDGSSWTLIASDTEPTDGWSAEWNTAGYSGPAIVRAVASDGVSTATATVTVAVDNSLAVAVTLSRHAFSPNGDGRLDATTLRVTLGVPATLSVSVLSAHGLFVQSLASSIGVEAGTIPFVWDGRASNGRRVPDGAYALLAEATDESGKGGKATVDTLVDTHRPDFVLRRIAPDPMRSIGPVGFTFRIWDRSPSVGVSYVVTDVAESRVFRSRPRELAPELATLSWNGRTGNAPAPPCLYDVGFVVRDSAGNVRLTHPVPFRNERPVSTTVVRHKDDAKGRVALTFDDCYSQSAWSRILSILDARHAQASFFCSGVYVAAFPNVAHRTAALGHTIGAHGWNHPNMSLLGEREVLHQLVSDSEAWWRVARVTSVPWFRPPYGSYDQAVLSTAGQAGYLHTVLWDVDPQDWRRPGASAIAARVLSATHSGSIVVLHTLDQTADALPAIIDGLRARGLEPVGLTALFRTA
ncbi:MAG: polysaccharide deacetylase family protein [Actinomycetota bacterium]